MWALSRLDPGLARVHGRRSRSSSYEFGSRGPNEWETPLADVGDPAGARARRRSTACARRPTQRRPRRAARRAGSPQREAASAELLAMVDGDPATHGQLAAAIGCSAAWLPGRERTKTNNIRVIHEMRMAMRELGAADGRARCVRRDRGLRVRSRKAEMPTLFADPQSLTEHRSRPSRRVHAAAAARAAVRVRRAMPTAPTRGRAATQPASSGWRPATCSPACPAARASPKGIARVRARLERPDRAGAGRHPGRTDHRSVVDAAVRARRRRGRRRRRRPEPRDHRQPRAGHPVRRLGHRRTPGTSPTALASGSTATPGWSRSSSVPIGHAGSPR